VLIAVFVGMDVALLLGATTLQTVAYLLATLTRTHLFSVSPPVGLAPSSPTGMAVRPIRGGKVGTGFWAGVSERAHPRPQPAERCSLARTP
jgi:hypothetical protein